MNVHKHYSKIPTFVLLLIALVPSFVLAADSGSIFSLQDILWTFVNNVFGGLLGISGVMLDGAIELFVSGFADTYISMGQGVDFAWVMIRDIFNLTFIFGLVWIGLKMILGSDESGARRNLIYLILAALLVNFSLFFTKFIIDFTNILATQILQSGFNTQAGISGETAAVSTQFMQMFGLSSVYDGTWINEAPQTVTGASNYMYIFGSAIVFLIGAFCFFAGAFMITLRFVALCIYMVFSPIMFLGWVFPQLQGLTNKYWSGFLGRAFFAPAYVILIYLAAYVMSQYRSTGGTMSQALNPGATGQPELTAAVLINFSLVAMFLIASVVVGNKLGTDGASLVMKAGSNLNSRAKRAAQNTAMFVPRRAGRAFAGDSANLARRMDNRLLSSNNWAAKTSRVALAGVGLDARTRNNLIESGRNAKMGTKYSTADNEKNAETQLKRMNEQQNKRKRAEAQKENLEILDKTTSTTAELNTAMETLAKTIKSMSEEEITDTSFKTLTDRDFALNLSDKNIESIEKSGKYSNDQIQAIKDARNAAQINVAQTGTAKVADENATIRRSKNADILTASNAAGATPAQVDAYNNMQSIKERIVSGSSTDVGKLKPQVFMQPDMYQFITPEMVENRMRNGVSEADRVAIRNAIKGHLGLSFTDPLNPLVPSHNVWLKWADRSSNAVRLFS